MEALRPEPSSGSLPDGHRAMSGWLLLIVPLALAFTFRDSLSVLVVFWGEPEYSHGYLIPLITLYLLLVRIPMLQDKARVASWAGVALLALGLFLFVLGELSALYAIVWYSFVLTIWAIALVLGGWRSVPVLAPALVFLLFMVPLPRFIQWNLSNQLQLISSDLGAAILRLMSVPVFVEGNVIDLGSYKLQVVEACSGLRYLFPLMCFGLLCAVMFRASFWQRAAVFLSSIPIAIGMNSFRIAVTGVLVNRFGTEAAEGFLHYFEGWVIFTACLALMFLLMWLFARFSGASLDDVLQPELPDLAAIRQARSLMAVTPPVLAAMALLAAGAASSVFITGREELVPPRPPLATFPLAIDGRQGAEKEIPTVQLEELKLTDYIIADYRATDGRPPVEMYVAYYESQRKGASIHSPKACLPGGGWEIEDIRQVRVGEGGVRAFEANRVVISLGPQRLLVYYWFMQRGRYLTNEYLVKWYLFWDSLTRRRTDGALVRLTVPVSDAARLDEADAVVRSFIDSAEPRLAYYIPGETAVPASEGASQVPAAVSRAAVPTLPAVADGR